MILRSVHHKLDRILQLLQELKVSTTVASTSVATETAVEQSAITLINGIPAMIAAAVATATAAGATPEQLAAFDAIGAQLSASSASLAAAVTANTPAAPPVPATTQAQKAS